MTEKFTACDDGGGWHTVSRPKSNPWPMTMRCTRCGVLLVRDQTKPCGYRVEREATAG